MTAEAAIDRIEAALCGRYNVLTPQELGSLSDALAAARTGDISPLVDALNGRELYRWRADVDEAIGELSVEEEKPKARGKRAAEVVDEQGPDEPTS